MGFPHLNVEGRGPIELHGDGSTTIRPAIGGMKWNEDPQLRGAILQQKATTDFGHLEDMLLT